VTRGHPLVITEGRVPVLASISDPPRLRLYAFECGSLGYLEAIPKERFQGATTMNEKPKGVRGGLPPGQKVNLGSLVSYQAGSVVSRVLIDDKAGTVTLFAFGEGEGLSEHTTPYDALLQLLEGEAQVIIAGTKNHLEQGEAIILPAGKPHAVRASRRFKMLLTMIRSDPTT
jgi:quercetin dioxygenase-like cupin family protein